MNFIIDDNKRELKIIDKDNLIYEDKDSIATIKVNNFNGYNSYDKVTKIIAILNNLDDTEFIIYKYILYNIIKNNDTYDCTDIIKFNSHTILDISEQYHISNRTIYRAIASLVVKGIIRYNKNNDKIINGEYILNKEYDTTKYFYKDKINFITIDLV